MTKKTRAKARRALLTLSLVLVMMMVAVGGTLAWLTASTGTVTNTFAPTTINLDLKEHDYIASSNTLDTNKEVTTENDYQMVPGKVLPKDPFVTVKGGSESSYVFVTVEKANNFDNFITATINTAAWTELKTENGVVVYYYGTNGALTKVPYNTTDTKLASILTNDQVTVNSAVTKTQLDNVGANKPTITFKAYAVQSENLNTTDIAAIWDMAKVQ